MSGPPSSPFVSKLSPWSRSHGARAMLMGFMMFGGCWTMAGAEVDTSVLENEELAEYRRAQIAEIERHAATKEGSESDADYFCTVYYTPKEGGFTAARGFD